MDEVRLTSQEVLDLATLVERDRRSLNFTNLRNRNMVAKELRARRRVTISLRTAHGSLLDPRYTVEGRNIPDQGLGNNYKQFQPKLYCIEVNRW